MLSSLQKIFLRFRNCSLDVNQSKTAVTAAPSAASGLVGTPSLENLKNSSKKKKLPLFDIQQLNLKFHLKTSCRMSSLLSSRATISTSFVRPATVHLVFPLKQTGGRAVSQSNSFISLRVNVHGKHTS